MKAALAEQQRVISALIYRELKTRFGRTRLGVIWLFIEPLAHMLALVGVWLLLGRLGPMGIPAPLFLISGIVPYLFYRNTVLRLLKAVSANKALLIFPQIKIYDLLFARFIIEIIVYIVLFVSALLSLSLLGYPVEIESPGGLLLNSMLLWGAAFATALFFIPLNALFPVTEVALRVFFRVLYVASGLIFSHQALPYELRSYLTAIPFAHVLQMIRDSIFVQLPYDPETMNMAYVCFFYGATFLIGAGLMQRYRVQVLSSD